MKLKDLIEAINKAAEENPQILEGVLVTFDDNNEYEKPVEKIFCSADWRYVYLMCSKQNYLNK